MERWRKTALMIALGAISAFTLLISTKDLAWFMDEIFAIMVSILFFSPVVSSVIDGKPPREWIVVFVIGGFFFVIYMFLNFQNPVEIVEFFFIIMLVTSISAVGELISRKLKELIPPN